MPRRRFEVTPVASGRALSPVENRYIAIRSDTHRQGGIHQIETFGAKLSHQQRGAREPHLGLWRAGDHSVVMIPDNDIADAHRNADSAGALDLGAADFETVLSWPIFSSIAAASQGVAMSRLIGPAPSRHHSAKKPEPKISISTATTTTRRLIQRALASHRPITVNPPPKR